MIIATHRIEKATRDHKGLNEPKIRLLTKMMNMSDDGMNHRDWLQHDTGASYAHFDELVDDGYLNLIGENYYLSNKGRAVLTMGNWVPLGPASDSGNKDKPRCYVIATNETGNDIGLSVVWASVIDRRDGHEFYHGWDDGRGNSYNGDDLVGLPIMFPTGIQEAKVE